MTTVRQIQRTWSLGNYQRLAADLLANRPEAAAEKEIEDHRLSAAAMAVIRLDELGQAHVPFYRNMLDVILNAQQADGGWGDLITTSLCLRALLACNGRGAAIAGGMAYLANLQQPRGIWPKVPLRRMPADAMVSAFVLYQLGDQAAFAQAVRLDEAMLWFEVNSAQLDAPTLNLFRRAAAKCRRLAGFKSNWSDRSPAKKPFPDLRGYGCIPAGNCPAIRSPATRSV